jgi:hypothetical protein
MYESYNPGPKKGEAIAIEFLQMGGTDGLLFAREKIGALLTATTEKVDLGWLLSVARETLGEQETGEILQKAGLKTVGSKLIDWLRRRAEIALRTGVANLLK